MAAAADGALDKVKADDTVCSFCGMSHLMYSEMRKKDKRMRARATSLFMYVRARSQC